MCLRVYFETMGVCIVLVGAVFGMWTVAGAGAILAIAAWWLGQSECSAYLDEVEFRRKEWRAAVQSRLRAVSRWPGRRSTSG